MAEARADNLESAGEPADGPQADAPSALSTPEEIAPSLDEQVGERVTDWLNAVSAFTDNGKAADTTALLQAVQADLTALRALAQSASAEAGADSSSPGAISPTEMRRKRAQHYLSQQLTTERDLWLSLIAWALTHHTSALVGKTNSSVVADWFDEWLVAKRLAEGLRGAGMDDWQAGQLAQLVSVLVASNSAGAVDARSPAAMRWLRVNSHQGVRYFNKEAYEQLVARRFLIAALGLPGEAKAHERGLLSAYYKVEQAELAMKQSGFDVDKMEAVL